MANNSEFDNKYSNGLVNTIGTIVRAFERVFIVFFDGLRSATVHGSPSVVKFFAALSPIITPIPMAAMTAVHLTAYLGWDAWQSLLMAISLEVVGFPLWVFLAEVIFVDGWKGTARQLFLLGAVVVYEVIIIGVNAILSYQNGDVWTAVGIFFLACLMPALSGIAYSYSNRENKARLDQEEQEMRDAQIRAELREERLEKTRIKHGVKPQLVTNQQVVDEVVAKPKFASDFKDAAWVLLDEEYNASQNVLSPAQLTERINKKHRVNLVHKNSKGFWTNTTKEWKGSRGVE